jgi:hypothetical protein
MKTGRNDPCPCGSGKKFKKCCGSEGLRAVEPVEAEPFDPVESFWFSRGELARQGCPRFFGDLFAATEMVADWLAESAEEEPLGNFLEAEANYARILEEILEDGEAVENYLGVRAPFDLDAGPRGRPPAALFLERFRATLPSDAVRAVEALLAGEDAFVSVEKKGKQKFLRRLDDGRALPVERTAGRAGDIALGRLVQVADHFCLFTPEKFSGFQPEECVQLQQVLEQVTPALAEAGLTSRKKAFALQLAFLMTEHGPPPPDEEPEKPVSMGPPTVVNADGHPMVLTTSTFDVLDLDRLARELARPQWNAHLDTEETPDGEIQKVTAVLSRRPKSKRSFPLGEINLATLHADRESLRLETNSIERDLEMRRRLQRLPAGILRFRATTSHPIEEEPEKPLSKKDRRRLEKEEADLMRDPEVRRQLEEMGRDYSRRWCDEVIPALGNRRPRTLVKTEAGRAKVLALLQDFERMPAPPGPGGMDCALIRRELGLPPAR